MRIEAALKCVEEDGSALVGIEIESSLENRPSRREQKEGRGKIKEKRPSCG
jgi:hypothetical protein